MERLDKGCEIGQNIIMKKCASLDKKGARLDNKKGASLGNRVQLKKGARLGKKGARLGTSQYMVGFIKEIIDVKNNQLEVNGFNDDKLEEILQHLCAS